MGFVAGSRDMAGWWRGERQIGAEDLGLASLKDREESNVRWEKRRQGRRTPKGAGRFSCHNKDLCLCCSSHFTILDTSWERSRGQRRMASAVSMRTMSLTPRAATNFFGDQRKFPAASRVRDGPAAKLPPGLANNS